MYCRSCGKELDEGAVFCGSCGAQVVQPTVQAVQYVQQNDENAEKIIFALLGFFLPIVGLIVCLCSKNEHPEAAKLGMTISGVILGLRVLTFFLFLVAIASG